MAQDQYPDSRILTIPAVDGYPLHARVWQRQQVVGAAPAPVVIINGTLLGDVHAGERVELAQKARVEGNVHYTVVEMSAGAQLTGRLVHSASQPRVAAVPEAAATPITAAKAAKA